MFLRIKRQNQGFTLPEVVIAVFGSLLLTLAIFTIFNTQYNQVVVQENVSEINQNTRLALNIFQNEVNSAGFEFRDEVGVNAIDPRLAILEFDGATFLADAAPNTINPLNSQPPQFNSTPPSTDDFPNAKAESDILVLTTPFVALNGATNALEPVCPNFAPSPAHLGTNLPASDTAVSTFVICNPASALMKCGLLNSLLAADLAWWNNSANSTISEPVMLIQWDHSNPNFNKAVMTFSITSMTYSASDADAACGGTPSITIVGDPNGFQVQPQDNTPYALTAADFIFGPPVPPMVGAIVRSNMYYVTNEDKLVRIPAGHDDTTHTAYLQEIADSVETLQVQFDDGGGVPVDAIDDGSFGWSGGTDPDGDTLNNTQSIATVRIGLIGITDQAEGLNESQALTTLSLFNFTPASVVDKFHRRVVARPASADNLRLAP